MAFHDVRFPAGLGLGALGGPERRTEIVTLANGFEERNTPWAQSRRRWDAGMGLRALDEVAQVVAFFEARSGQLHAFRWKDWSDFRSGPPSRAPDHRDQLLGVGDGQTRDYRLRKAYVSGAQTWWRPITRPVSGSVLVAIGDLLPPEGQGWRLEGAVVVLDEPLPLGVTLHAGFEFDVPVRFDTDRIHVSVANFQAGDVPSIPVVEVRE